MRRQRARSAGRRPAWVVSQKDGSWMTPIGVAEGEVLSFLDEHGTVAIRRLVQQLEWPAPIVLMGVGALIRDGLACVRQHGAEMVVATLASMAA